MDGTRKGSGDIIFKRSGQGSLTENVSMNSKLKVRVPWASVGRTLQAEGPARTKALRQGVCLVCSVNIEKARVWWKEWERLGGRSTNH